MAISPQRLNSAHRAVIFAIAQLSCWFYGHVSVLWAGTLTFVAVTVLFFYKINDDVDDDKQCGQPSG